MSKDKVSKFPLLPIGGKIIVLPKKKEKITASGLYLAESSTASDKPQIGTVIKIGMEKLDEKGNKIPFSVKEGMEIMFRKYSGDEIEFEDEKYLIMEEDSIMAIIEN